MVIMRRRSFFLIWVGFILGLLASEVVYDGLGTLGENRLIISGVLSGVFFGWQCVRDLRQRRSVHALQIYLFGSLLHVGGGGVYAGVIIATGNAELLRTFGYLPLETMPGGLFMMQIATACLVLGIGLCEIYLKGRNRKPRLESKYIPSDSAIWLVAFAGWAWRILSAQGFPSAGIVGYCLSLSPNAAIYAFTLSMFLKKASFRYIVYVLLILVGELWFYRGTEMRETYAFILLPVLLAVGIGLTKQKTLAVKESILNRAEFDFKNLQSKLLGLRLKYIYLLGAVVILFTVLVIFPAASIVKLGESRYIDQAVLKVLTDLNDDVSKVHEFPDKGIFNFGERMALIVVSSGTVLELNQAGVGMDYDPALMVIAGFVPRAVWQEKPIISRGGWFTSVLDPTGNNTVTATALTSSGELFWAYGWAGMCLGLLIMGWLVELVWTVSIRESPANPVATLALIYICQECFRWFEAEATAAISLILLLLLATLLYSKLFYTAKNN